MKKENILKTIYYYQKAKTASYDVKQYLKKSNIVILDSNSDDYGLISVSYYNKSVATDFYYTLEKTCMGFVEHIHEGLQDIIGGNNHA